MTHPDPELAERLATVDAGIADAARAAGRDAASITRIVVTKFHPASLVAELAALGVRDVGESRHQEARAKAAELQGLGLRWHFIGQLQRNKAVQASAYARVVHSVDSAPLADALARGGDAADPVACFVQVDLSGEDHRGGVAPDAVLPLADRIRASSGLRLLGLMTVAPRDAEPRAAFAAVRELSERLRLEHPDATALSMGMSGDYQAAVSEGATHLRLGEAITGKRPGPA